MVTIGDQLYYPQETHPGSSSRGLHLLLYNPPPKLLIVNPSLLLVALHFLTPPSKALALTTLQPSDLLSYSLNQFTIPFLACFPLYPNLLQKSQFQLQLSSLESPHLSVFLPQLLDSHLEPLLQFPHLKLLYSHVCPLPLQVSPQIILSFLQLLHLPHLPFKLFPSPL